MSDNNIDNIFKNAASQYSAPAPKASWSMLDSALKKQRKAVFIRNISVAATFFVVVISSLIITFNIDSVDKHIDGDIQQDETVIKTTIEPKSDNIEVVEEQNSFTSNKLVNSNASETNTNVVVESKPIYYTDEPVAEETTAKELFVKKEGIITSENAEVKNVNNSSDVIVDRSKVHEESSEIIDNSIVEGAKLGELIVSVELDASTENNNEAIIENNENSIPKNTKEEKIVQDPKTELTSELSEKEKVKNAELEGDENKPKEVTIAKEELVDIENIDDNYSEEFKYREPKSKLIKSLVNNEKVEFFVGNSYSVSITNGRGENKVDYDDNLAVALNTKTSFGLAASVDFGIKYNNFIFSASVRRYDQKTQGDFLVKEKNPYAVDAYNYGYTQFGVIKLIQMNTNARLANPSSALYVQNFDKYSVRLRFLELPISVAYDYKVNNWSLIPHIGVNPTFLVSNEVKLEKDEDVFMFAEIKDVKKFMLGMSGGVGAYYNISNHWRLGVDADFIYYAGSVNNDASKFNYCPYSLLIGPRVEFKF